jgi:Zn-dependent peptidase ImmA (M78 family)
MNPEIDASELLNAMWRGKNLPVDPVQIAWDLGLNVVETDLPENISGALIKDLDKDPVIFLSKADSNNRKRFTCAHEIGHYAYRLANNGSHYEFVDFRDGSSATGDNQEEVYANQFAANLLMPADEVAQLSNQGLPSFLIAQHFGVSDDAIRFRLKNLRLAS